jgi:hypothetical protein
VSTALPSLARYYNDKGEYVVVTNFPLPHRERGL